MKHRAGQATQELATAIVLITIGAVSIFFWRGVQESFDLVKATILWTGGLGIVALGLSDTRNLLKTTPKSILVCTTGFVSALMVSTFVSSSFRWTSFWGQSQRYTGLLTLIIGVMVMLILSQLRVSSFFKVGVYFSVLAIVSTAYVLIQYAGHDPFAWSMSSFSRPIFGTIGNPNTAAGFAVLLGSFPLAVGLRPKSSAAIRVAAFFGFFLLLISIEILDSFQANGAALLFLAFPIYLLRRTSVREIKDLSLICLLTTLIVVFPNLDGRVNLKLLVAGLAALLCARMAHASDREIQPTGRRFSLILLGVVPLMGLAVFVIPPIRRQIQVGLRGGFLERGDFYRAGWRIFRENPLLGTGLETFGFYFGEFRPASHAISLESSRSSSVHNIFLGMFDSGGLLLGLFYIALIASLAWLIVRMLRSGATFSVSQLSVAISFVIFQVISLVTVEHIVLFTFGFALFGILISQFKTRELSSVPRRKRLRDQVTVIPNWGIAVGLSVMCAVSAITVWRPMQAAKASVNSITAASLGQRLEESRRATEAAPWEGLFWVYRAESELALNKMEEAVISIERALDRLNYSAAFAPEAARVLAQLGRFDLSLIAISRGIEADPYAPQSTKSLLELLGAIEEAAVSADDQNVLEAIATVRAGLPEHLQ